MNFRVRVEAHTGRLYNGHTSFYACLDLGRRHWWLMRWDVARAPEGRLRSRDGLMGWTWGLSR